MNIEDLLKNMAEVIDKVAKRAYEEAEAPKDRDEELALVREVARDHIRICKGGHGVQLICMLIQSEALLTGREGYDVAAEVAARIF